MVGFPNKPMGFPIKNDHFEVEIGGTTFLAKTPIFIPKEKLPIHTHPMSPTPNINLDLHRRNPCPLHAKEQGYEG